MADNPNHNPEGHTPRWWRKHPEAMRKAESKEEKQQRPKSQPPGHRLLEFIEYPLFLAALGLIGSVVGVLLYAPMLAVCGVCVVLAFHRVGVVRVGSVWRVQLPTYVLLCGVVIAGLYGLHVVIDRKMTNEKASLIKLIKTAVSEILPKQQPQIIAPSTPPAIEITVACEFEQLPITIPIGETAQIVGLNPGWPRTYASINEISNSRGYEAKQWPDKESLARSKGGADLSISRCDFSNHTSADILDLTIPFYSHFGIDAKTRWRPLSAFINPLDKGRTRHIYFVNDCPVVAEVSIPKTGSARFAGEQSVRKFSFELPFNENSGAEFWPSYTNWTGMTCSYLTEEQAPRSSNKKDENEPSDHPIILPPGAH
jgi:hypothetical protein